MLKIASVSKLMAFWAAISIAALPFFIETALAYDGTPQPMVASEQPKELDGVGIDEKLGQKLDLNLRVKDETGREIALGSFFDGKLPVILSPVYFACPGLCNLHLNSLTDGLKLMDKDWSVGKKFKVLSLSFDSKETPDLASKKKQTYMKIYGREGSETAWNFLTADEATVQAITKSIGFKFKWDEQNKEWAHASAAVIVTPTGTISRYLPGIMNFDPKDIKLALNEATEGKIGSIVDNLVLYCFKYDPHQSKYTLAAVSLMKMGGAVMVLVMVLWLLPILIRSRRAKSKPAGR